MNRLFSNVAAGATHAALIVLAFVAIVQWRGMTAEFSAYLQPDMLFQFFMVVAVLMTVAFAGLQSLWEGISGGLGLNGLLSHALGCTVTMLLFSGIWLASSGWENPHAPATIALFTAAAFCAGIVRHLVSDR